MLQGREQGARLDTLYGSDVRTLAVVRHHQTRQAWFSVDLYGAARACAHVAASLRACEPDVVANYVEEQCMLIDSPSPLPAVNGQAKQLWVEANVLGSVLHDEQDSITDMTVAQDTMMCLGIGVAANLGINSTGPLKLQAQKVIRNGFLASWLPFTAALLLAWRAEESELAEGNGATHRSQRAVTPLRSSTRPGSQGSASASMEQTM